MAWKTALTVAAATAAMATGAQATATLTGNLTVDNAFFVYLSNSPTTLGTLIGSGTNWESVQSISASLTPGQNYYLQVFGFNYDNAATPGTIAPSDPADGNPDAFIGGFSLAGTGFVFENGLTTLGTDTADWQSAIVASPSYTIPGTFAAASGTPVSFGANGTGIWGSVLGGPFPGISSGADLIWATDPADDTGEAFFETEIRATAITEPATWALTLTGLAGLGAFLRKRPGPTAA